MAQMLATLTKLPFCTEGVPMIVEGQIFLLLDIWTLLQIRSEQFSTVSRNIEEIQS